MTLQRPVFTDLYLSQTALFRLESKILVDSVPVARVACREPAASLDDTLVRFGFSTGYRSWQLPAEAKRKRILYSWSARKQVITTTPFGASQAAKGWS